MYNEYDEDVYGEEGRSDMVDNDEMTPEEQAFMQGYDDDMDEEKKKKDEEDEDENY